MNTPWPPEDIALWPDDPFELFGLNRDVSLHDLRRACSRLLKFYKSGQLPLQLARVREAYESARTRLKVENLLDQQRFKIPAPREDSHPSESQHSRTVMWRDELSTLWTQAYRGKESSVYRRMTELHDKHPGNQDLCLRLYWLLVLKPSLDNRREPCDWLAHGLRANGLTGPLRELYRRELLEKPEEAITGRCGSLLDCRADLNLLAETVEWRWLAAFRLRNWDLVIENDLLVLRDRISPRDELIWARLLFSAADLLAWGTAAFARQALQRCRQEVEQLVHQHAALSAGLDRLNFLLELSPTWERVRRDPRLPEELVNLVPWSWTMPFERYRQRLLRTLPKLAENPAGTVSMFDHLEHVARPVATQIGWIFGALYNHLEMGAYAVDLMHRQELARDFLEKLFGTAARESYGAIRYRILEFCLEENLAPADLAGVALKEEHFRVGRDQHLSQLLHDDWPIRQTWLACQAFKAAQ